MKQQKNWTPTRVILKNGEFRADINQVSPSSYYLVEALLLELPKIMQTYSKGVALDCGCGQVPYFEIYSKKVDAVFCVDWENSSHPNPYVDFFVDLNKDKLPFEDNFFDTVYLNDVLEHIYNPFHLLKELKRTLKKDGHLIVSVPFMYQIHEQPFDYFRYTEFFFRKWAQDNSFEILDLVAYGGRFDVAIDNLHKFLYQKLKISKLFIKYTSPWLLSSWIRKYVNRSGKIHFPIGYCVVLKK